MSRLGRLGSTAVVDLSGLGDQMAQGYQLAQRDAAMRQQAEQFDRQQARLEADDAIQMQLLQEELSARKRAAEQFEAQREATERFWAVANGTGGGFVQGPAGPRPGQVPEFAMGNPGGQTPPAPMQAPTGQSFGHDQGSGMIYDQATGRVVGSDLAYRNNPQPFAGGPALGGELDAKTIANLPPSMQAMFAERVRNRFAFEEKRARLMDQYQQTPPEVRRIAAPQWWDEILQYIPDMVNIEEAPAAIRQRGVDKVEAQKQAWIDLMTLEDDPAGSGMIVVNEPARVRLTAMQPEAVQVIYEQWKAEQARRQALALVQERNKYRTDPLADDMLRIQWQNITSRASAADKEYRDAYAAFQRVNVDNKGRTLGTADVSQADIERSRQEQDPPGLRNKLSNKEYERLRGRVAAWERLQDAKAERDTAAQMQAQFVQQMRQRQAAPAAGGFPGAQPGTQPGAQVPPPKDELDLLIDSLAAQGITDPAEIEAAINRAAAAAQ